MENFQFSDLHVYLLISLLCLSNVTDANELNNNNTRRLSVSSLQKNGNAQRSSFFTATLREGSMSAPEIIKYHGYPVEEHNVTTEDGYVLRVQRIPHGIKQYRGEKRKPVLLQHGFTATSVTWIMNVPENNLAYRLADSGHDVWLANVRGNTYGLNHVNMSSDQSEFWRFSFHEMGLYDLPATIDFILQKTGQEKIGFVGISQGTTMLFVTLSMKPEYNEKINVAVLLGPAAGVKYFSSPLRYTLALQYYYNLCPTCRYSPDPILTTIVIRGCAFTAAAELCKLAIILLGGFDNMNLIDVSRLPVYISHYPDVTSNMNVLHTFQLTNGFQMYDYGKERNLVKYAQPVPPHYNLSKVTAPLAIFWSEGDAFTTTLDIMQLFRHLKGPVKDCFIPGIFSHAGFIIRTDINEVVYDKVLKIIDGEIII